MPWACSRDEPPRDVTDVSSPNTSSLFKPMTSSAWFDGIKMNYTQATIGFDAGCNVFEASGLYATSSSVELNQCAKLPESVKSLATSHCESFGKKLNF